MSEATDLDFREFLGELRELHGRVVSVVVRDAAGDVVAYAEGEFADLEQYVQTLRNEARSQVASQRAHSPTRAVARSRGRAVARSRGRAAKQYHAAA